MPNYNEPYIAALGIRDTCDTLVSLTESELFRGLCDELDYDALAHVNFILEREIDRIRLKKRIAA